MEKLNLASEQKSSRPEYHKLCAEKGHKWPRSQNALVNLIRDTRVLVYICSNCESLRILHDPEDGQPPVESIVVDPRLR